MCLQVRYNLCGLSWALSWVNPRAQGIKTQLGFLHMSGTVTINGVLDLALLVSNARGDSTSSRTLAL